VSHQYSLSDKTGTQSGLLLLPSRPPPSDASVMLAKRRSRDMGTADIIVLCMVLVTRTKSECQNGRTGFVDGNSAPSNFRGQTDRTDTLIVATAMSAHAGGRLLFCQLRLDRFFSPLRQSSLSPFFVCRVRPHYQKGNRFAFSNPLLPLRQ
jgi:hypothetical protein